MEFTIWQCTVCEETSYLNTQPKNASKYLCLRCSRDKHFPRKFSKENNMIPAKVPSQLQELTQIEEMLISRALPIMRVYIKPRCERISFFIAEVSKRFTSYRCKNEREREQY